MFLVVQANYISRPLTSWCSWQPAGRSSRVPRCHYTAGDYQSTSLGRNLEAPDMQGSEQNMDSLPLRHRSIAICNPSPGPAHDSFSLRCPPRYQVPRSWKRAAAHRQGRRPTRLLLLLLLEPTRFSLPTRLRLASHLATTTGPPARFDTLSYEPYVPLQVAVTQQ